MADVKDKLTSLEALKLAYDELNDNKVGKTNIKLGIHTDGLLYVFVDDSPVGDGINLTQTTGA